MGGKMKKTDIIIFGGQSNMQGQTECLSENERVENAFEYKFLTNELVPLQNPVGECIRYDGLEGQKYMHGINPYTWLEEHALGGACYGHTNLVPAFVRAYIKETGASVVAVHTAKGSTQASQWLPDTENYRVLKEKVQGAVKKASVEFEIEHIYFVWLQGESDALSSNTKKNYKNQLREIFASLRELGVERFGIIRVGRFANDDRDLEIISAQDEICESDEFFVMLTKIAVELNEKEDMMNPQCAGHFSAKGLETLGTAAGKALGAMRG